ncbi:MAG: hypothetical protein GX235_08045 [Clostridiales bacterium]|nr:hypothetical protein [Clostridiales bacterium]
MEITDFSHSAHGFICSGKAISEFRTGSKHLVAPVLNANQFSRNVYLPSGVWKSLSNEKEYRGGQSIECDAPIDDIPVFKKFNE